LPLSLQRAVSFRHGHSLAAGERRCLVLSPEQTHLRDSLDERAIVRAGFRHGPG
jgi:hypothetical protein